MMFVPHMPNRESTFSLHQPTHPHMSYLVHTILVHGNTLLSLIELVKLIFDDIEISCRKGHTHICTPTPLSPPHVLN